MSDLIQRLREGARPRVENRIDGGDIFATPDTALLIEAAMELEWLRTELLHRDMTVLPAKDAELESLQARILELEEALRELIECKDLKEQLDAWDAANTQHMVELSQEYDRRKPLAWANARKALSQE